MYYFYNVAKLEKILSDDTLSVRGQSIISDKSESKLVQEIENLQKTLLVIFLLYAFVKCVGVSSTC
jgi:hypothetical protein